MKDKFTSLCFIYKEICTKPRARGDLVQKDVPENGEDTENTP